MTGEARSAIHSPSCASSVQNQLTPPTAVRVDAKMAMQEVRPRRLSGLKPRCDILSDRGTRERIRSFAGFVRAFLYRSPLCRLAPYWPRNRRRIPGLSTIGGPSIGWKRGSAGLRGGRQMVSQSRGAGIRRSSISVRIDDGQGFGKTIPRRRTGIARRPNRVS
jgi:hypothetical protein